MLRKTWLRIFDFLLSELLIFEELIGMGVSDALGHLGELSIVLLVKTE